MYKIGEFSIMSKTTIKTLRYYEKEKLLIPKYIDRLTGYRYYVTSQLVDVSKIVSLRQVGISIKEIKKVLNGQDVRDILLNRKEEVEENILNYHMELTKINYMLEENNMKNEIFFKEIPSKIIFYREGIIKDYSEIEKFVLETGNLCRELNPELKCSYPDYCYISYLDGEYKENNIKIRYSQAVESVGKESREIKFMEEKAIDAVCIYHKGAYSNLRDSYNIIMKYIENNDYEVIANPRECYIEGCWGTENEEEYLTEIQVPVRKVK